eukprot:258634_1
MGICWFGGRVLAREIHTRHEISVLHNERTLDVNDPSWIIDIQCNLMLADDRRDSQHGFRPKIATLNGFAANLINNGQVDEINHNLKLLWNQSTQMVNPMIQKVKSDRTKHLIYIILLTLLVFIGLLLFITFMKGIDLKIIIFAGSIFLLCPIFLALCYQSCFYQKQMSKIKEIWRESFLSLIVQYIDELQRNYNHTDIKFAVLYPMQKPIGAAQASPFVFIRLSKGIISHNPTTLYHVPTNDQQTSDPIEGE